MRHAVKRLAMLMVAAGSVTLGLAHADDAPPTNVPPTESKPAESNPADSQPSDPKPAEAGRENDRGDGRDPTTRPGGAWRNFGGGMGGGGGMGERGGFRGGSMRDVALPSEEEWNDIVDFMTENSPVRLDLYRNAEAKYTNDPRIIEAIKRRIAFRYRELIKLRDGSPDMYGFSLKQLQLEDQVLGTMIAIRKDGETGALADQMKTQLHDFIDNTLKEREQRVGRLKEILEKEEATLKRDRDRIDELMKHQRDRFERDMKRLLDVKGDDDAPSTEPATQPTDKD